MLYSQLDKHTNSESISIIFLFYTNKQNFIFNAIQYYTLKVKKWTSHLFCFKRFLYNVFCAITSFKDRTKSKHVN